VANETALLKGTGLPVPLKFRIEAASAAEVSLRCAIRRRIGVQLSGRREISANWILMKIRSTDFTIFGIA
jgi:hypothetical protein